MHRSVRIPPDLAPVLELYRDLGRAARRGLWLAKRQTEAEVREAVRRAHALARRNKDDRRGRLSPARPGRGA